MLCGIVDAADVLGTESMPLEHLVGIDPPRKGPAMVTCEIAHALVEQRELFAHLGEALGLRGEP